MQSVYIVMRSDCGEQFVPVAIYADKKRATQRAIKEGKKEFSKANVGRWKVL